MKRKFNKGDLVLLNEKAGDGYINWWLENSPLGIGQIIRIEFEYRSFFNLTGAKRLHYVVRHNNRSGTFYSWQLNLVSRNEDRNKTSKNSR